MQRMTYDNVISFPGFSVAVTLSMGQMSVALVLPPSSINRTRGLLGVTNGNPDDDFTFPNGTVLPPNSNMRDIFYYGEECEYKWWRNSWSNCTYCHILFLWATGKTHG